MSMNNSNEVNYKSSSTGGGATVVKSEPVEPDQYKTASNFSNGGGGGGSGDTPYFTNPMSFKQEPSDPTATNNTSSTSLSPPMATSSISSTNGPSNAQDGGSGSDSAALSIVSQLLKDKQILNQLEKVAQTFRHPTASVYQGSWNFQ